MRYVVAPESFQIQLLYNREMKVGFIQVASYFPFHSTNKMYIIDSKAILGI